MQNKIWRFCLRMLRKMRFLPPKIYAHYLYEYYTGKKLNLDNPKEFNEKIQWLKVFYHPKILNQLVDKFAVREYVENKIGAQYLNEIYGVYDNPEDISFEELPDKFVVKATHASSYNLIVSNKEKLNIPKVKRKFRKWLGKSQYYRTGQEWAYKDVPRRLIIEKFMKEDQRDSLVDYKFFCFNGEAKFVHIHVDREHDHKQAFYDLKFNLLPFRRAHLNEIKSLDIEKADNFEEMVVLSESLAGNFPFVRVDLYSVNGKTIFGELTFYPADGRKEFYPEKYNRIIGNYIKLPKLKKGQKVITETH